MKKKFFRSIAHYLPQTLLLISLLTSNVLFPAIVIAQEVENINEANTVTQEETVPTVEVDTSEDILEEGISTSIYEPESIPKIQIPSFTFENGIYTVNNVIPEEEYIYPENDNVRVKFTEVKQEGNLIIKRVELTEEQKELLNTKDNYGWDITSSMENGTFKYTLTLPNIYDNTNVEVKYTEDGNNYESIEEVSNINNNNIVIEGLDHFTVFITTPKRASSSITSINSIKFAESSSSDYEQKCKEIGNSISQIIINLNTGGEYSLIQDAIDGAGDTHTLCVGPGKYNENIDIRKAKGIIIISANGPEETIIFGTGGTDSETPTVTFSVNEATLNGFTINGSNGQRAIAPTNSQGTKILNNIIVNAYRGIQGDYNGRPTNLTIANNVFEKISYGIAGTEDINYLLITRNTFKTSKEAIGLGGGVVLKDRKTINDLLTENTYSLTGGYAIGDYRVGTLNPTKYTAKGYLLVEAVDSIQAAVNAAASGDTVLVKSGTYNENVTINKSITLLGDSTEKPTINGGIELSTNGVTIDGFEIQEGGILSGSQKAGIYIHGGTSGHKILNNEITGGGTSDTYGPGIIFGYYTSNINIEGNTITNWYQGIYINPSSNLTIENNIISTNYVGIGSDGLNNVQIIGNTFSGNTSEAIGSSNVGTDVEINNNNFTGNEAGVNWYSGNTIDATMNWWGHHTGPSGDGLSGLGDKISENILYKEWLCQPYTPSNQWVSQDGVCKLNAPTNSGWNVSSLTTNPGETPVKLSCGSYTNDNTPSQVWTAVAGNNIKYQRQAKAPNGDWWQDSNIYTNTYTPFLYFGQSGQGNGWEGEWNSRVRAFYDENNNGAYDTGEVTSDWSNECTITYDITAPVVHITSPSEGTYLKGTVELQGEIVDNNLWRYFYRVRNISTGINVKSDTVYTNSLNGTFYTWNTTSSADGKYIVHLAARDLADNQGTESIDEFQVTVDNTQPQGEIKGIRYGSQDIEGYFITNDNTPKLFGRCSDTNIDTVKLTIDKDTSNIQTIENLDCNIDGKWEAEVTQLSDGSYTVTLTITDKAGNTFSETETLIIDTIAPTATYVHYKDDNIIDETINPITYVHNIDQLSFTATYTDKEPSSGLLQDSYAIFEAQDDGSFKFSQNGKKSFCNWRTEPNLVTGLSGYEYTLTEKENFMNCISTLPDGEYYMAHQVYDRATRKDIPTINQFRDVLGLHFIVDTEKPVIVKHNDITLVEGELFPSSTVSLTDNYELLKVCGIGKDITNTLTTSEICVDTTLSNLTDNQFKLMDVIKGQIETWKGKPVTTVDLSIIPAGQYEVTYYAYDKAGNKGNEETFTITVVDNVPTVTITAGSTQITQGTSTVLGTTVTNGNSPYTYQWSGTCTGTESTTTFTGTNTGTYTCTVTVADADGDTASSSIDITVTGGEVLGATTGPTTTTTKSSVKGTTTKTTPNISEDIQTEELLETTSIEEQSVLGERCENKKKVSGYVYIDKNKDKEMNDNEEGIKDITITIQYTDEEGNIKTEEEVSTDEKGYWETQLCSGKYNIVVKQDTLPKNIEVPEVLSLTVSDNEKETIFNIQALDTRNFWQKYWYLIVGGLAIIVIGYSSIKNRKKEEI